MGGVCFAEADDEMRYRHPSQHPGMHPHGHPGMRGGPRPPPTRGGPPPTHGHVGPYSGNRFEDEEFGNQKFRSNGFNHGPPGMQTNHGPPGMPQRQMHGHPGEPPKRHGFAGREFEDIRGGFEDNHRGFEDKGFDNRYEPDYDDHLDGYDDSQEKRQMHPIYPYEQDSPQMAMSPPGQRRKSLSDRLNSWSERNRSSRLDSHDPMSLTQDPMRSADRDDNNSDDYPSFPERAHRKKSLQERVAEFKERRKNSQVRFDDESYSEAQDRHEHHRDFYGILDKEAQRDQSNMDMESDHSYEIRDNRVDSRGHERQASDREERKERKKRKKSRDGDKESRKKKSKRKGSKGGSREGKDKKKRTRKNSDRKKEKKQKRSKEERGADRERPRKRTSERRERKRTEERHEFSPAAGERRERKRTEERHEFSPATGPHRLSQENIELFTRRLSHRSGEREFDTQSYQPPSKRKTSDRSYRSAPEMDHMRQYHFNEDRRDFAIHE